MPLFSRPPALREGDAAPDFSLQDQDHRLHNLRDYRGDWLVIYFYLRDENPGCITEACEFQANYDYFRMTDIKLLGVSMDLPASHARFRQKHQLGFPLLSDTTGQVCRGYGSLSGSGPLKSSKRHTFIIDPTGTLVRIFRQVDPREHPFDVIRTLHELTSGE